MAEELTAPPVLSTPDTYILNEGIPEAVRNNASESLSDEEVNVRYEIDRTIQEIRGRKWRRVALQFPDHMLPHSARVYQLLSRGLQAPAPAPTGNIATERPEPLETDMGSLSVHEHNGPVKLTILGDTSYGSCCVDEIAAEHVDADAVVHYGRACLSPTARLPVLHIYTTMPLDYDDVVAKFQQSYPDPNTKVILTADVPYSAHVSPLTQKLQASGYLDVFAASIVHDPSSAIPNRTLPPAVSEDQTRLSEWSLFHISDPPTSLLLTLTSRLSHVGIYSTQGSGSNNNATTTASTTLENSTRLLLRRRYALITSLTTVPIWGILINTLSVKNYLNMLTHIQRQIAAAGKRSYLFVVGKLNSAKIANFSEIGGWVVIGCWESSLVDSKDFYRPIITPFELDLALQPDDKRVWTGEWRADFDSVLEDAARREVAEDQSEEPADDQHGDVGISSDGSESESEPPEFDFRTGRYVSRSRPMHKTTATRRSVASSSAAANGGAPSTALTKRSKGDVISANGIVSPAAEYLKEKRGWTGLGSDFVIKYEEDGDEAVEGGLVEEGRTGIARGYTVGESTRT
ncbi:diphthamide biosynthesis protein 2 [Exophiala oligosperma]|uniref:2-(3-amino-3-carboxypropyl)histidine synthase subunit 2 n=1 Tax=Exophiala oligosperma TaxID=215243 RepID=A0A0D2BX27_9EURO|nr:diphthamide biosynthesis protein 2 [Exophiala oligosperma]KIW42012.1 diphthamide biosynthesis protein 2 [Exophiala oligosperma]